MVAWSLFQNDVPPNEKFMRSDVLDVTKSERLCVYMICVFRCWWFEVVFLICIQKVMLCHVFWKEWDQISIFKWCSSFCYQSGILNTLQPIGLYMHLHRKATAKSRRAMKLKDFSLYFTRLSILSEDVGTMVAWILIHNDFSLKEKFMRSDFLDFTKSERLFVYMIGVFGCCWFVWFSDCNQTFMLYDMFGKSEIRFGYVEDFHHFVFNRGFRALYKQ